MRVVAGVAALCVVAGGVVALAEEGSAVRLPDAGSTLAPDLDPAALLRTAAQEWADTSRVDFTAWPARGDRTDDRALLGRALRTWGRTPKGTAVSTTPGALAVPPPSRLGCCTRVRWTAPPWCCSTTAGYGWCATRSRCPGPGPRPWTSPGPMTPM